jgi:predicted metal-dependent phosphoesterase TrpH
MAAAERLSVPAQTTEVVLEGVLEAAEELEAALAVVVVAEVPPELEEREQLLME